MKSLPSASVPAKPDRKPLPPVRLLRVECEASIADLIAGHAVLAISVGDQSDSATYVYWLQAHRDYHGRLTGFQLSKFASGERYHLPADLSSCSCGDQTFRPEREGGCKHMAAMRRALVAITQPDRKSERDDITSAESEDFAEEHAA